MPEFVETPDVNNKEKGIGIPSMTFINDASQVQDCGAAGSTMFEEICVHTTA
jgi:hypothetical protein